MTFIRAMFLLLAVTLPTSWTLAHAADEGAAGAAGDKSKKKSGDKKKKKEGDTGKSDSDMK